MNKRFSKVEISSQRLKLTEIKSCCDNFVNFLVYNHSKVGTNLIIIIVPPAGGTRIHWDKVLLFIVINLKCVFT